MCLQTHDKAFMHLVEPSCNKMIVVKASKHTMILSVQEYWSHYHLRQHDCIDTTHESCTRRLLVCLWTHTEQIIFIVSVYVFNEGL